MKIIADGKEINADSITIIWPDMILSVEGCELHLRPTDEGIILDVWDKEGNKCLKTTSMMAEEMIDQLCQ